jgi:low affinity Fe/Cu permease
MKRKRIDKKIDKKIRKRIDKKIDKKIRKMNDHSPAQAVGLMGLAGRIFAEHMCD